MSPTATGEEGEVPVNAWVSAILKLGVLPVIALYLIWKGSTVFEDRLKAVEDRVHEQHDELLRVKDLVGNHAMLTEQWIIIARQTCINVARNDIQRRECGK